MSWGDGEDLDGKGFWEWGGLLIGGGWGLKSFLTLYKL